MKKLIAIILSLFIALPASALTFWVSHGGNGQFWVSHTKQTTQQVIIGGGDFPPSTSAVSYGMLQGNMETTYLTTSTSTAGVMPVGGVLRDFRFLVDTAPDNGAGTQSWTVALTKNDAVTNVSCTISEAEIFCTSPNRMTYAAGDLVALKYTPSGTPASPGPHHTIIFESDVPGASIFLGSSVGNNISAVTQPYLPLGGHGDNGDGTTFNIGFVIPTNGHFRNLYVNQANPGVGNSYIWALQGAAVPAVPVDQTITCTISSGSTTCTDLQNTDSAIVGNTYNLELTYGGSPSNTQAQWGIAFIADTLGEFLITSSGQDPSQTATNYNLIWGVENQWTGTESGADQLVSAMTIKNMYVQISQAPGVGKSYAYTLRRNIIDTSLTCTISGANKCNISVNVLISDSNDMLAIKIVPTNTPLVRDTQISFTGFIKPKNILWFSHS